MLELLRDLTPAEVAGGFGLAGGVPAPVSVEETFRRRIAALPSDSRRLLQLAAADPVGDPLPVWRAAARLGVSTAAATAPAQAGLLEIGARVRFRHPLVRSTAYWSASLQERQEVHRALAEVTDREIDPDRHAWHRAHAAPGPDEDVAEELDRSAARAQARAVDVVLDALAIRMTEGYEAAAPLLTRALELLLAREMGSDEVGRSLWLAASRATQAIALELWDADAVHTLAARQLPGSCDK